MVIKNKIKFVRNSFLSLSAISALFALQPSNAMAQANPLEGLITSLQGNAQGQEPQQNAQQSAQQTQGQQQAQENVQGQPDEQSLNNPNTVNPDQNPNLFFDGDAPVPQSQLATQGVPRVVNPQREPASRLVVVQKDAGPESLTARLIAADRALKLGRVDSALNFYEELYVKNSKEPRVLLGLAVAYQRSGQEEAAINTYNELLDMQPENLEAQVNMLGLMGARYPAVSLKNLEALRAQNPGHIGILAQMAFINAQVGRFEDAIEALGVASSLEPRNPNHVYNMAVIADKAGDNETAMKYYQKALEIDTVYSQQVIPREAIFERMAVLR